MSQAQELVVAPDRETAMQVFTKPGGLEPYLVQVRSHIDEFVPDVSTAKGRKEVASMAAKVARSKTALDGVGKDLVAELKELPRKVDAERKRMRDTLDKWRDEVRLPLTEIEEKEKERQRIVQENMEKLASLATTPGVDDMPSQDIAPLIDEAEATPMDLGYWGDRLKEAERTKAAVLANLESMLARRRKQEEQEAELERLRKEAEARAEQDRIREAEERAKREAAEAAERERQAIAQQLERERQEREASERRAKEEAERAEREHQEAIRREREEALERERERARKLAAEKAAQEEEARRVAEEEARRLADQEHRANVNCAARDALLQIGKNLTGRAAAEAIVRAIARGDVPHVTINY